VRPDSRVLVASPLARPAAPRAVPFPPVFAGGFADAFMSLFAGLHRTPAFFMKKTGFLLKKGFFLCGVNTVLLDKSETTEYTKEEIRNGGLLSGGRKSFLRETVADRDFKSS